jgi:hypothetical protein
VYTTSDNQSSGKALLFTGFFFLACLYASRMNETKKIEKKNVWKRGTASNDVTQRRLINKNGTGCCQFM